MGLGSNFYGFFVVAAIWVGVYFLWASWINRREAEKDKQSSKPGTTNP